MPPSPPTPVDVQRVADYSVLCTIWRKTVRPRLRAIPLPEFELAHDPLDYVAFNWDVARLASRLSTEVPAGAYEPTRSETIRAAKSIGLTRPLSALAVRDRLLYKSLVEHLVSGLATTAPSWARFGRADSASLDDSLESSSGWFRAWLRRQGQLWTITESHRWLAESDISNFFPSIDVDRIVFLAIGDGGATIACADLLKGVLLKVVPTTPLGEHRLFGLPQEIHDCSRPLAHAYVADVDRRFEPEGTQGRYSRWVDDIIIGTNDYQDAVRAVARVQGGLESIGLYPNASKTRIYSSTEFVSEYYKEYNDYLGECSRNHRAGKALNRVEFRSRLGQLTSAFHRRRRGWERVLRRAYTISRQIDDDLLMRKWHSHIRTYPGSARHVFEYLTTYRLTVSRIRKVRHIVSDHEGVYEDIELLALEYLLRSPNRNEAPLQSEICDWMRICLASAHKERRWRLAASSIAVLGKYGSSTDHDIVASVFDDLPPDTVARVQAVLMLMSRARINAKDVLLRSTDVHPDVRTNLRFLGAIEDGDARAVKVALGGFMASPRRSPTRSTLRFRAVMVASIGLRLQPSLGRGPAAAAITKLSGNRLRLRDIATELFIADAVREWA